MKNFVRTLRYLILIYFLIGMLGSMYEQDLSSFIVTMVLGGIAAGVFFGAKLISAIRTKIEQKEFERTSPAVSKDVKKAVFLEAVLVGALLDRLDSERFLHEKELPPNIEITTRRVLLDWLSRLGMREDLEPWLNDLLLAQDGHWTQEQMNRVGEIWEYFEALRWVMGMEKLRRINVPPKFTGKYAAGLVSIRKLSKLRFVPPWDVRLAREQADAFFSRCWYELAARGEIDGATEEEIQQARAIHATFEKNCYQGDYRIGAYFVPSVASPVITVHMHSAWRRWAALSLMVEVLGGNLPPSRLRDFLRGYLSPGPIPQPVTGADSARPI